MRLQPHVMLCAWMVFAVPVLAMSAPQVHAQDEPATRATAPHVGTQVVPAAKSRRDAKRASSPLSPSSGTQQTATTLPAVQVEGFPFVATMQTRQRLTPGAIHLLDGASFYRREVTNLADALRYIPGVMAVSNAGGDDGVVSIRGSNLTALSYANSGVALFQDGLPVSTADGNNHNRLLDPAAARYVIVANGANALRYGASVLGGAIDFITLTVRNSDPQQIYLGGGAYGHINGHASTGGVYGNFDGMLTVGGNHFAGYRQHSRENRINVRGNAGWQVSDALKLRTYTMFSNNRQQLAGSLTRAEFADNPRQGDPSWVLGNHQLDVKTGRAALKGNWAIDAQSALEFGVSWEIQSLYHPIVDVFDFRTNPPVDHFSLLIDTTQRTAGGMLRYRRKAGTHKLLVGLNLARTHNQGGNYANDHGHRGVRADDIDQTADNATLFVLDRWAFAPQWTLVYGTQGVVTNRDVRDVSLAYHSVRRQKATYASLNPRLGIIRKLGGDSEAFASVSRLYQAPSNFALDNDVRQDNHALDAMHGLAYEMGTRGKGSLASDAGSWRWNVALYYATIHDEILSVENPAQPGTMLSTNYDRTTHAGVEALVRASFAIAGTANRIEPLLSASWNHFRFHSDAVYGNNRLPSAPDYALHGQILYRNRPTGFYVGPTFDVVGARYADMANTFRVGGYTLLGLRIGIERANWQGVVEATNLTGKDFVNTVSVRTRAGPDARVLNPGAPRSVYAGVRIYY